MGIVVRKYIYGLLSFVDRVLGYKEFPVAIFCYHSIASDDWRYGVEKKAFIEQMEYLLKHRQPITADDVLAHISGEKIITEPSFLLCFDDGYQDILSVREYLATCNIKPLLFVLSNPEEADFTELGTKRAFLSLEEIKSLQEDGWSIGSHGATHGDFWQLSEEQQYKEVDFSKKILEQQLGVSVQYFAYPRGRYDQSILEKVAQSGYRLGFSMDDGRVDQETNQFVIPRIGVDRTHSSREFQQLASPSNVAFRKIVKELLVKF